MSETATTPMIGDSRPAPSEPRREPARLREAHERAIARAERAEAEVDRLRRTAVENAALRAGIDPDGPAASVIVDRWPAGLEPTPDAFREQFAQLTADVLRTQAAPNVRPSPAHAVVASGEGPDDAELAMQRAREAMTRTEQPHHPQTKENHDG